MYKLVKYKINENTWGEVIGLLKDEKSFIPISTDNIDYLEYLDWLTLGNEPLPAEEQE